MNETAQHTDLRHLLGAAARAHHAVYGGPSDAWARWYAEWMYGELVKLLASNPSVDTVEQWLKTADERYTAEQPPGSWPGSYASWFIAWDAEATEENSDTPG